MSGIAAGASAIPNVFGGFAPFPNSIMIPFMGAQSAVLGYQFGINYEFGKRTIKAMSNPEFNAIVTTPEGRTGLRHAMEEQAKHSITMFRNLIPDFQSLQNDIIEQSVVIEVKKAERTPSAWAEIITAFTKAGGQQVKDSLNSLPEHERLFIISAVPILGIIYALSGGAFKPPTITEPIPTGLEPVATPTDTSPLPAPEPEPLKEETVTSTFTDKLYQITFYYDRYDSGSPVNQVGTKDTESGHQATITKYTLLIEQGKAFKGTIKASVSYLFYYRSAYNDTFGYWPK